MVLHIHIGSQCCIVDSIHTCILMISFPLSRLVNFDFPAPLVPNSIGVFLGSREKRRPSVPFAEKKWKVSIPQGKPWTQEALPPFPPQGTGYLTLLSRHSLGRGTIMLIPFLSLRWGMKSLQHTCSYMQAIIKNLLCFCMLLCTFLQYRSEEFPR